MRVLLQFPEGLKKIAVKEAKRLEKDGHEVFVSLSPCFGACDIAFYEAERIGADKIIHYGHSYFPIPRKFSKIKVEYKEFPIKVPWRKLLGKALGYIRDCRTVGIATTIQHIGQLEEIKGFLEKNGKTVLIGKGRLAKYAGQILGCDLWALKSVEDKADCLIYFGGGLFHPLGMKKRILVIDPFMKRVFWLECEDSGKRMRRGAVALANAKRVGIFLSTKAGQFKMKTALEIKKKIERMGKDAVILLGDNITREQIENFASFDLIVNTACPRIADDELGRPVLNADEVEALSTAFRQETQPSQPS